MATNNSENEIIINPIAAASDIAYREVLRIFLTGEDDAKYKTRSELTEEVDGEFRYKPDVQQAFDSLFDNTLSILHANSSKL